MRAKPVEKVTLAGQTRTPIEGEFRYTAPPLKRAHFKSLAPL
jgi:hypothetical protein